MECSTHSVLVQCVVAALEQLVGDLNEQAFGVLRFHIGRDRPQHHRVAAKVRDLQTCVFQQGHMIQQGLFFLSRQVNGRRLQQHLTGHIAVVGCQLFVQLALMGSVLVDEAQFVAALGQNIGTEHLAHIAQRLRAVGGGKVHLLRLHRLFGSRFRFLPCRLYRRCRLFRLFHRNGRLRVPGRHVVLACLHFCLTEIRFHVQLCFATSHGSGSAGFFAGRLGQIGNKRPRSASTLLCLLAAMQLSVFPAHMGADARCACGALGRSAAAEGARVLPRNDGAERPVKLFSLQHFSVINIMP